MEEQGIFKVVADNGAGNKYFEPYHAPEAICGCSNWSCCPWACNVCHRAYNSCGTKFLANRDKELCGLNGKIPGGWMNVINGEHFFDRSCNCEAGFCWLYGNCIPNCNYCFECCDCCCQPRYEDLILGPCCCQKGRCGFGCGWAYKNKPDINGNVKCGCLCSSGGQVRHFSYLSLS